jgi:hypothetical protein
MTENSLSNDASIEAAPMCFACGPANPIGLQIRFTILDGKCHGQFTANENHVGFENTVHGGIIATANHWKSGKLLT